ncbi:Transcriptional regulator IclR family [Cupriavidus taiwanensis]|uniref:IclR family transcriptional regulator n=1 Tax=Cupriavidus taiwanensis TaxID=164546 RepID=UPI000E14C112|nr:helix-turn-helix domain-containing protein [Cupriavidus taiwanensis]SOZ18162.1 Transcriptional regulator IclR family [Cupriavidus taiwanensis]SOZ31124.1 Transcriptional regulator IclR family [Cupriavidus taiwanensis]SOZ47201.1 Transcriptional regulator IclR family [Cupriavidus taiwanensis]
MPDAIPPPDSTRSVTHRTGRFTRETAGSQSLERGLVLLRAFRVGTTSLTNAELAARTGLPRPTVSRLTRSLVDAGFLRYDVNERAYRLAPVVLSLADAFHQSSRAPEIALPLMRRVAEAGKVNVGLAVGDQLEMVYLASIRHSRDSVSRTRRVVPGSRVPMELTAIGLSWLAAQPEEVRRDLLAGIAARQGEAWTGMRARVLRGIAQAQRHGHCTAAYQPGHLLAVGAAFSGPDQQLYGLNISYSFNDAERRRDHARHAAQLTRLVAEIQQAWRRAAG